MHPVEKEVSKVLASKYFLDVFVIATPADPFYCTQLNMYWLGSGRGGVGTGVPPTVVTGVQVPELRARLPAQVGRGVGRLVVIAAPVPGVGVAGAQQVGVRGVEQLGRRGSGVRGRGQSAPGSGGQVGVAVHL